MKRILMLFALMASLSVGAASGAAPDTAGAGNPLASRWTVLVCTFGTGRSAGVFHRWGEGRSIGLTFEGSFSTDDSDVDHSDQSTRTQGRSFVDRSDYDDSDRGFSIDLDPELRWSHLRGSRVSVYHGVALRTSYSWYKAETETTDRLETSDIGTRTEYDHTERRSHRTSVGLGLTLGASLAITEHLSLLMALAPASFDYSWSREEWDSHGSSTGADNEEQTDEQHRESTDHGPAFSWDLDPGLYVTIGF